ncbi:hypothetical protein BDZ94DRAFT_1287463 [Collybia nuda]|uniref:DUF7729 domain-containing protein n=1 Tax=Collybia nuda TaxID=64659 RepID=A0A9P5YFK9_9AGAR|nr:hypothetical protein BDZ94DRAFT_1287463 [Collybia nuda]
MFTPPPSPLPFKSKNDKPRTIVVDTELLAGSSKPSPTFVSPHEKKRAIGRRTIWTVLAVPLVIILITASTRYFTHPVAFDIFSQDPAWHSLVTTTGIWTPHKRHPAPEPQKSGSPTPTTLVNAPLPTIPTNAILPTPFPQPFDSDITQNFSSISCFSFFSNMTNAPAFRSCRPFSMLQQSSSDFINAQTNATLLNSIVWGTCNTNTEKDQCVSNMGWFASTLKTACAKDLADNNAKAVDTLQSLQAYSMMRDAGCLPDPTTNTYCYLSAANNPSPSDSYFYQLPLGHKIPPTSTPTCSACTKSLMTIYSTALEDPEVSSKLDGLRKTYPSAAQMAVNQCGAGYAQLIDTSGALSSLRQGRTLPSSHVN